MMMTISSSTPIACYDFTSKRLAGDQLPAALDAVLARRRHHILVVGLEAWKRNAFASCSLAQTC
jgi:hypothetical protein